jgi:hypothetical protein
MTTTTFFPASEKQISFINDLLDSREIELGDLELFREQIKTIDKKHASTMIDTLLRLPRRATKVTVTPGTATSLQEALRSAPKSKYAISNEELDISLENTKLTGDHLFIEIREYMGNLFMRRLYGAPGGFTRVRVSNADAVTIANHIAQDPYKYARTFGEIYQCCGSCGADLTDPRSRELQLGPECRKKFGKA